MQKLKNWLRLASHLIILPTLLFLALPASAAGAQSAKNSTGSPPTVTQAYTSNRPLEIGMIVGLSTSNSGQVEPLSNQQIKRMQGVVVPASGSSLTLSNQKVKNQVFVASLGRYGVLVSDQNGAVEPGDYLTISSLAGIGMKSTNGGQLVVGKAVTGFDGSKNVLGNDNSQGRQIDIGQVTADLNITHNPAVPTSSNRVVGISFLQNVARAITGKEVNPTRVYAALVIFVVIALIAGALLYAGIRGDMIATGRNPLAKAAIGRSLLEVVLSAIVIFIIGLGAIYLVLKL